MPNLDWRIGPRGEEATDERLDRRAPPTQRQPRNLSPLLAATYLITLVAAAFVGFAIGRWSEARAIPRRAIENQLQVESLAWRDGDLELFEATVDPEADPSWRGGLIEGFSRSAPMPNQSRLTRFEMLQPDRIIVEIEVETAGGTHVEEREYVLRQATWYRAEPQRAPAGTP